MSFINGTCTKATEHPFAAVEYVVLGFDKVMLRGPRQLTRSQKQELRAHCFWRDEEDAPTCYPSENGRWFNLHLVCPSKTALTLANDWMFDRVGKLEPMANLITKTPYWLRDYFRGHLVIPYNRGDHVISFGTDYFGQRGKHKRIPLYYPDPDKMTGEVCLHGEDRITGSDHIRQKTGIETTMDLITFNHPDYWKRRLKFVNASFDSFGRQIQNRARGERRQAAWIKRYGRNGRLEYNFDSRLAGLIMMLNDYQSLQKMVQKQGRGSWLIPIETGIERLLDEGIVVSRMATTEICQMKQDGWRNIQDMWDIDD